MDRYDKIREFDDRLLSAQHEIQDIIDENKKLRNMINEVITAAKDTDNSIRDLKAKYSDLIVHLHNLIDVIKDLNSNASHYIPQLNSKNKEIMKLSRLLESKDLIKIINAEGTKLVTKRNFIEIERNRSEFLLWIDERNDSIWIYGKVVKFSNAPKQLLYDLVKNVKSIVSYSVLFNIRNRIHKKNTRTYKNERRDRNLIHRWAVRLVSESESILAPYILCISHCVSRDGYTKSGYLFDPQSRKFCVVCRAH